MPNERRRRPTTFLNGVRSGLAAWWARTGGPGFLSSRANCRDAWVVLLPLYGPLVMYLDAAVMQGTELQRGEGGVPPGESSKSTFAADVAVSLVLFFASLLPKKIVLSDFCISAIFGAHVTYRQMALGTEARLPFGAYQLVATLAMTSAGVHTLAVAAFVCACAATCRSPQLLVCVYMLGAAALSEHRVALLFAGKFASGYRYKEVAMLPSDDDQFTQACDALQVSGSQLRNAKSGDAGCTRRSATGSSPRKVALPHDQELPFLVLKPEKELLFGQASNSCVLRMTNASHGFVAFTVRARQQGVWNVRPHHGTLARGQSVDVTVSRKDRRLTVHAGASRDELLVRAAVRESADIVPSQVWRAIPRSAMQEWSYGVRRGDVCGDALAAARAFAAQAGISPATLGRVSDSEKKLDV